jgi:hypothetical protein
LLSGTPSSSATSYLKRSNDFFVLLFAMLFFLLCGCTLWYDSSICAKQKAYAGNLCIG